MWGSLNELTKVAQAAAAKAVKDSGLDSTLVRWCLWFVITPGARTCINKICVPVFQTQAREQLGEGISSLASSVLTLEPAALQIQVHSYLHASACMQLQITTLSHPESAIHVPYNATEYRTWILEKSVALIICLSTQVQSQPVETQLKPSLSPAKAANVRHLNDLNNNEGDEQDRVSQCIVDHSWNGFICTSIF